MRNALPATREMDGIEAMDALDDMAGATGAAAPRGGALRQLLAAGRGAVALLGALLIGALWAPAAGAAEPAAAPASAAAPGDVTLRIWQGFKFEEQTVFSRFIEDFRKDWEARHPGRKLIVKLETVPFDNMVDKVKTAALAKQTPDLAFVDGLKVIDMAYGRVLLPFDTLPNFGYNTIEEAGEDFVPAAFGACVIDRLGERHLYGFPAQVTTLALFWNRKLFAEAAPKLRAAGLDPNRAPVDWDEFSAYGKALTNPEKGVWGYGFAKSLWFCFPMLNEYGVEIVQKDASGRYVPSIASPRGRAAIEAMVKPILVDQIEGGSWKAGGLGSDQGFLNGRYAMILMGPWFVEKFKSAGLDFGVTLIPRISDREAKALGIENPVSSSNIGGQTAVIFRETKHPEVAYELIKHVTSSEVQAVWAEELGQIPVRLSAFPKIKATKFPEIKTFMEQIKTSRRPPPLPMYGILETVFNAELDLILTGSPIDERLKSLERTLDQRLLSEVNTRAGSPGASAPAAKK